MSWGSPSGASSPAGASGVARRISVGEPPPNMERIDRDRGGRDTGPQGVLEVRRVRPSPAALDSTKKSFARRPSRRSPVRYPSPADRRAAFIRSLPPAVQLRLRGRQPRDDEDDRRVRV
eukprot:29389-Pelagococcus_subviridis.AAC.2